MRIEGMKNLSLRLLTALALATTLAPAAAKGDGFDNPRGPATNEGPRNLGGVQSIERGPYRYVTSPSTQAPLTFIAQIDKRNASVGRWWHLRGKYWIPEVAFDGSSGAISADGNTLVVATTPHRYPPKKSKLASIDTGTSRHAVKRLTLPGAYTFHAISPDGSRIYLTEYFYAGVEVTHWVIRALDTETRRLLPGRIVDPSEPRRRMDRTPITQVQSLDGRWAYTLYGAKTPFVYALDTVEGRAVRVDLPQLPGGKASFRLRMKLVDEGRRIEVYPIATRFGGARDGRGVAIDTETFDVREPAWLRLDLPANFLQAF
jgi:hypothetical protein